MGSVAKVGCMWTFAFKFYKQTRYCNLCNAPQYVNGVIAISVDRVIEIRLHLLRSVSSMFYY